MPFLILFVLIPLAEVYAFIHVGEAIGVVDTLLLCVLTAIIGGFLVRKQGLETLFKAQKNLQGGHVPIENILDGICIIIAGALLLTPGFVTDITGFILLIPPARPFIRRIVSKYGKFKMQAPQNTRKSKDEGIIEGEYVRVKDDDEALDHDSK